MHVVIYTHHWKIGGIERVVKHIAEGLRGPEFSFSILTEDVPNPDAQLAVEGAKVYFREFSPFKPAAVNAMRALLLKMNPDVVVTMGSTRSLYKVSRALVGTDIPVIISEHNASDQLVKAFHNDQRFFNAVRNLADLNHVLFGSYAAKYDHPEKVRVIGNPVIPAQLASRKNQSTGEKKWLLNLSRYDLHQKQQDVLVKAFSKIADKFPDWNLALFGDDWKGGKSRIEELVRSLGLQQRVNVNIATRNPQQELLQADIFAFPSAYEGFPLAVGEALAHGLPVVAFNACGGTNQLIEDGRTGVLARSHVKDVDSFSRALASVMADDERRRQMSENAITSVEPYTLNNFLTKWRELLIEAVELKGKNVLRNCSAMETHYIDLVAAGTLFDENAKLRKENKLANRLRSIISKYRLEGIAKRVAKIL